MNQSLELASLQVMLTIYETTKLGEDDTDSEETVPPTAPSLPNPPPETPNQEALFAKINALQAEVSKLKRKRVTCTNCGKDNHSIESCFAPGGGSEHDRPEWYKEPRSKRQKSANLLKTPLLNLVMNVNAASVSSPSSRNLWISDSGCNEYVTCRKEWLSDFVDQKINCNTAGSEKVVWQFLLHYTIEQYENYD